jgi:uncharacterized protein (TIGR00288 family)
MSGSSTTSTARVAILVDCDNVSPEIAEFALQKTAGLGRLVIRRGYGMHPTLGGKWQEMLVREAFTPCLQYAYAPRKNTTDIALALDAMEILLDGRADAFCLVTSDSDFAYLCRKLRERGAAVFIVGDAKSPPALRKSCDQFFEGKGTSVVVGPVPVVKQPVPPAPKAMPTKPPVPAKPSPAVVIKAPAAKKAASPVAKQSPSFVLDAVRHLAAQAPGGKVGGVELGQYLSKTQTNFSPKAYGHAGLMKMVKSYPQVASASDGSGKWTVALVQQKPAVKATIQIATPPLKPVPASQPGTPPHFAQPALAPLLESAASADPAHNHGPPAAQTQDRSGTPDGPGCAPAGMH